MVCGEFPNYANRKPYKYTQVNIIETRMASPPSSSRADAKNTTLNKIRRELTCCICTKLLEEPKSLPCLHNCCLKCLDDYVKTRILDEERPGGDSRDILICPVCKNESRLSSEGVKKLQTNFTFVNLVEHLKLEDTVTGGAAKSASAGASIARSSPEPPSPTERTCVECEQDKAIKFCTVCNKHLCSICVKFHGRSVKLRSHPLVFLAQVSKEEAPSTSSLSECSEFKGVRHNPWRCGKRGHEEKDVEIYCKPCDQVGCMLCAITEHCEKARGPLVEHNVVVAANTEVYEEYEQRLAEEIKKTRNVCQKFEVAIEGANKMMEDLENTKKKTEDEISEHCESLKAQLDQQRDELIHKAAEIARKKKTRLEDQIKELKKIKHTLGSTVQSTTDICESCIPIELLFLWSQFDRRLKQLCEDYDTYPLKPQDNDIIYFEKNIDLTRQIEASNALGQVFADPYPPNFTAEDLEDVHFIQGSQTEFTMTCQDIVGTKLSEHCYDLQAEFEPEHGEEIQCAVQNKPDGTYKVAVQPQIVGPHRMTITACSGTSRLPVYPEPLRISVSPPYCEVREPVWTIDKERSQNNLVNPWGIALSKDEKIVVSDIGANCLLVFDNDLNFLQQIGRSGNGEVEFKSPRGLAITPNNNIVVAEKENQRVQEVTFDRNHVRYFTMPAEHGQFRGPTGVAINAEGIVFVTDSTNQNIQHFSGDGTHLGKIGEWGTGSDKLNGPYGIALYNQPRIGQGTRELVVVTERQSCHVQCFTRNDDGEYKSVRIFGTQGTNAGELKKPVGIAVDPTHGYIYVSDMENQRISIFTKSGHCVYAFGTPGHDPTQFENPMSIAVMNNATIAVTDCYNCRLLAFRVLQ